MNQPERRAHTDRQTLTHSHTHTHLSHSFCGRFFSSRHLSAVVSENKPINHDTSTTNHHSSIRLTQYIILVLMRRTPSIRLWAPGSAVQPPQPRIQVLPVRGWHPRLFNRTDNTFQPPDLPRTENPVRLRSTVSVMRAPKGGVARMNTKPCC